SRLENNLLLDITSYSVNDEKTRAYILRVLRKKNLALRVKARDGASQEGQLFERATKELLDGDPCKAARDLQAVLEINPNNARARQIIDAIHTAYFKMKAAGPGHATLIHFI